MMSMQIPIPMNPLSVGPTMPVGPTVTVGPTMPLGPTLPATPKSYELQEPNILIPDLPEPELKEEPKVDALDEIKTEAVSQVELDDSEPSLLHDLEDTDSLHITRVLRMKGAFFLRGKKYKFFVKSPEQEIIYSVEEENNIWASYMLYGLRPFQLHVKDTSGAEVIRIRRQFSWTMRYLPCQLQHIQVYSPPGMLIGTVEQKWSALRPIYLVKRASGEEVFEFVGPKVTLGFFKDVRFQVSRCSGEQIGETCKRWQGLVHMLFVAPIHERFSITYEKEMPPEEKALLMAASILLDYMYYDI